MSEFIVQLSNISKRFGTQTILENISLDVRNGEFLTLLGPSGCGKTTLLRIISGSEFADQGKVIIQGSDVTDLQPEERHVHMVFQNYALFPHMSVFDNVAFGLECKKVAKDEIKQRVMEMLRAVKLEKFTNHKPSELSGGQQQRVAIARAVVNRPIVLLLDEPLSALDYDLRKEMQVELKELQRSLKITFILVTHDQEEALSMSDRIVVMKQGNVEQIGSARDVYENPTNLYVADFIGDANIFFTEVMSADGSNLSVAIEGKTLQLSNRNNYQTGHKIVVIVRPEDVNVYSENKLTDAIKKQALTGVIQEVIYKGSTVDLMVKLPSGQQMTVTEFFDEDDETLTHTIGDKIWMHWPTGWEVILNDER